MSKHVCTHCGKRMERDSKKLWVKSFCDAVQKTVHLLRVKK